MKVYIVMQIGCIECGIDSFVLSVHKLKEEAEKMKPSNPRRNDREFEVFEIEVPQ